MPDRHAPRINRRRFLATSAAAAAGLATGHRRVRADSPPRVGLIGCGAGGQAIAETLASKDAPLRLVAVCDTDGARRVRLASQTGAAALSVWEDMLSRSDIEAVIIATPDDQHLAMATAAADAGKAVYLLPMAVVHAADARALRSRCASRGTLLYVGMEGQHVDRWANAAAALGADAPSPRWIHVTCAGPSGETSGHWSHQRDRSLGAAAREIFNTLYPMQYHFGLGAPVRMTALGGVFGGAQRETLNALSVTACYSCGSTASITCGPGAASPLPPVLRGDWGALSLNSMSADARLDRYDLDGFSQALAGHDPDAALRLEIACATNAALIEAIAPLGAGA